jgi:hypothetical protein
MEEKKLLKINLSDFSFSNGNKTKKKKSEKQEGNIRVRNPTVNTKKQNNTLRKKSLLNLIRQQQQKQYDVENNLKKPPSPTDERVTSFNKEFEEAKNYLNTIAEKRGSSVRSHNATVRTYPTQEVTSVSHNVTSPPVQPISSVGSSDLPSYGCLKNGTLPTYRNYMNKTLSNREPLKIGNEMKQDTPTAMPEPTERSHTPSTPSLSNRFPSLYAKPTSLPTYSINMRKSKKLKQRKTIRRKHKVGRSKYYSKIGVLVSNRTIRNNISNQIQQLKMVPIHDVRTYLIKNGFIKVGSNTPNDVLRKMYESALLICGEVKNHNSDNILYNFFNDTTKDEE